MPDAQITQDRFRLFIETKLGGELDRNQISRHIKSIATEGRSAGDDFLIGLTKEPISLNDTSELRKEAAAYGIKFAAATFSQITEAFKAQCAEFERELLEIVEDYEEYLSEERLLEESNRWLVVFPCGTSLTENIRFNLYYEPASRPCKRNYRFIGIYAQKTVAYVGMVEAIAVTSFEGGTFALTSEVGVVTNEHRARITNVIEETRYYDLKSDLRRFYLVDRFVETDLRKSTTGGLWGLRYLDLSTIVPNFRPDKNYATEELARLLKGREFQ
ncbi:MAG: hypothetical protein IT391_03295 [Nitrospira sp.]|nr:hypothetical protein [Nitrospira sp.]